MFLRRFTDYVLQGRLQAIATAFIIAFIPVIGSISILIAALVTLRKGAFEGAVVAIAATLPYVISYFIAIPPQGQEQMALEMLMILIASNILTWFFAILLYRFNNWNLTLELGALIGIGIVLAVHLFYPDIQAWWVTQLNAYFMKVTNAVDKASFETGPLKLNEVQLRAINAMKHFATGFLVVSIILNALLQLVMARWWQAVIFNPGGLRKELYQIHFSHVAGAIFVIGLALSMAGSEVALDAMPIIYAIFCIAGLSLIHQFIATTKNGWLWLIIIYSGVIWLFPVSIVLIAIVALLDTGLNFRKRFNL